MISVLILIKKVIFVVYRYLHKLVLNPSLRAYFGGMSEIFITNRFFRQSLPESRRNAKECNIYGKQNLYKILGSAGLEQFIFVRLVPERDVIFITEQPPHKLSPESRRDGIETVRQRVSVQFVYNSSLNSSLESLILEHI
jgi:hypothetical protein